MITSSFFAKASRSSTVTHSVLLDWYEVRVVLRHKPFGFCKCWTREIIDEYDA